jgi:hypothetical protein
MYSCTVVLYICTVVFELYHMSLPAQQSKQQQWLRQVAPCDSPPCCRMGRLTDDGHATASSGLPDDGHATASSGLPDDGHATASSGLPDDGHATASVGAPPPQADFEDAFEGVDSDALAALEAGAVEAAAAKAAPTYIANDSRAQERAREARELTAKRAQGYRRPTAKPKRFRPPDEESVEKAPAAAAADEGNDSEEKEAAAAAAAGEVKVPTGSPAEDRAKSLLARAREELVDLNDLNVGLEPPALEAAGAFVSTNNAVVAAKARDVWYTMQSEDTGPCKKTLDYEDERLQVYLRSQVPPRLTIKPDILKPYIMSFLMHSTNIIYSEKTWDEMTFNDIRGGLQKEIALLEGKDNMKYILEQAVFQAVSAIVCFAAPWTVKLTAATPATLCD